MTRPALPRFQAELAAIREQGLFKAERIITSAAIGGDHPG